MFKNIIEKLANPLLYYADKSGNSVFRNFCLIKDNGNLYKISILKANVGKALEYRFELDKYLKLSYFLTPIILYLIFIHVKFSLFGLLFFELLWLSIISICRAACSSLYSDYLIRNFGKYKLVEFTPPVPKRKIEEYNALFRSKIILIIIVTALFFLPAVAMQYAIKLDISSKQKFKQAINLSNTYFAIYPKSTKIYDMRAYAKYRQRDFEGALKDYKTVLDLSGKNFTKRDFTRFANLLYLQKKVSTPTDAVDVFNEYLTKKNLSVLEASQMLWIKSLFKIENNIPEGIMQDYNDLISSLSEDDTQNQFYISSDKAYILYIMKEYATALNIYNTLIAYAEGNKKQYKKELKSLYAERGFTKKNMGDIAGGNADFISSQIEPFDLAKYEPSYESQVFVTEKF